MKIHLYNRVSATTVLSCAMLCLICNVAQVNAATVTWTIDTAQSWIRLTIPDQEIIVGGNPTNAWLRSAPTTFDPSVSTPTITPPVATNWTDSAGRLTYLQGTFTTDYNEGSSIQFSFGNDTMSLGEVGSFVPNRNFYTPGPPENYNFHTLPPDGHPACFAFDLTLGGAVRIAPCAIWGMNFDMNGTATLSGTGPWTQSGGSITLGGENGAILDFWAMMITGPDRLTIGTTQGPNTGSIVIEDIGSGVRKITIPVNCFFTVLISGLPLSNSRFDGQIVAFATVTQPAQVLGSFVYHGGYSGSGSPIDSGKQLAKEGSGPNTLSYNNVINTSRGINAVVFDIQNLPEPVSIGPSDFEVHVSPTGVFSTPPSGWAGGPAISNVVVTGSSPHRVRVEWPDNSIMNRWLRLTIKANANTGLTSPETYYLGHLLGETGPTASTYTVSFGDDVTAIRNGNGNIVNSSSILDIDKNGTVSFADISAMRAAVGSQLSNITIP